MTLYSDLINTKNDPHDCEVTLLGKPISTQHLYGQVKNRRYMKTEAKHLKSYYIQQIQQQYHGQPLKGDLIAHVSLYFPDKRRRDRDNWHKLTMDSLEGIVFKDDSQISECVVSKCLDKENPRIHITINVANEQLFNDIINK